MLARRISGLLDRPRSRVAGLLGAAGARSARRWPAGRAPSGSREALSARDLDADRDGRSTSGGSRSPSADTRATTRRRSRTWPTLRRCCSRGPGRPSRLLERLERLGEEPAVAVVGTRSPSPYGLEVAYALGRGLGAAGVPVVSGLALGIDAAAHRGCLAGGGHAGRGAGVRAGRRLPAPPPRSAREVRERGLVLAELPPGHAPVPLELSGAQPDHGRAGADDGGGRGRRPEREPDHERLRARPGSVRRGRARPRHQQRSRAARTACSATAPCRSRDRGTCSTSSSAPGRGRCRRRTRRRRSSRASRCCAPSCDAAERHTLVAAIARGRGHHGRAGAGGARAPGVGGVPGAARSRRLGARAEGAATWAAYPGGP